jgi:hypothetical protein
MRLSILSVLTVGLVLSPNVHADSITTFENLGLPAQSFNNNAGSSGQFVIDGNQFNNRFDSTFGTWSGWAISSMTDNTTPGFMNQYSTIPGSGAGNSQTYAVGFTFGQNADPFHPAESLINLAPGMSPESVEVTNTTYAYLSMLNGDAFARKFGPGDFFLLSVQGYSGINGMGMQVGEVDFYLANFPGTNSYIINTWETLDLSSLAGARSLRFGLQSSDNNASFGMNTPAYFAIDNLSLLSSVVPEPGSSIMLGIGLAGLGGLYWTRRRATIELNE